jgi:glutamate dehydrogenase (NAD(P)+)
VKRRPKSAPARDAAPSAGAWVTAQQQLRESAEALDLDEGMLDLLATPRLCVTASVPIKRDDGKIQVYTGHRVQHSTVRGPAKGGIRYQPGLTLDDVKAHAMWMSWQNAVMGLPYGGAKGGVACDPKELSESELERLTRRYTSEIISVIGPEKDIPHPGLNTNPQIMAWMMDTYSMTKGYTVPGVVTGKPVPLGGSLGRSMSTARGLMTTVLYALKRLGIERSGLRVAIQGYGNTGYYAAKLLHEADFKIVGASSSRGGTANADGLDPEAVLAHYRRTGSVSGFKGGDTVSNEELLELECDILLPCAVEHQLTARNASKVKAKIVGEGANGPATPEADEILYKKGVFVVPDILANAGGVTVSYFEWVQALQEYFWTEREVNLKLRDLMERAFEAVWKTHKERKVHMRRAAQMLAISRVAEAYRLRGLYP